MTLHWNVGRDDTKDDYVVYISGDIDKRLAQKCISPAGVDISLFYVNRRHVLEILPEFVLAFLVAFPASLTLALAVRQPALAGLMGLMILGAVVYFLFEVWRWDNEIVFVTQSAVNLRFWNWSKFEWDAFQMPINNIATTKTSVPLEFNVGRIQAGNVLLSLNSGGSLALPLTPDPYRLAAKIEQAKRHGFSSHGFKGASPWEPPVIERFRD